MSISCSRSSRSITLNGAINSRNWHAKTSAVALSIGNQRALSLLTAYDIFILMFIWDSASDGRDEVSILISRRLIQRLYTTANRRLYLVPYPHGGSEQV